MEWLSSGNQRYLVELTSILVSDQVVSVGCGSYWHVCRGVVASRAVDQGRGDFHQIVWDVCRHELLLRVHPNPRSPLLDQRLDCTTVPTNWNSYIFQMSNAMIMLRKIYETTCGVMWWTYMVEWPFRYHPDQEPLNCVYPFSICVI